MNGSDEIISLKGIGEKTAKLFQKLGIETVFDLLNHFPRDYESFDKPVKVIEAGVGEIVTLELTILGNFKWKKIRQLTIGTGMASDNTGKVSITYFNMPYLKNVIRSGNTYLMRGKLKQERGVLCMEQPKLYTYEEYAKKQGTLQPCYGLTAGLTNNAVTKAVKQAMAALTEEEYLPDELLSQYCLVSGKKAYEGIHFPQNYEEMMSARRRLVFDEFFLFLIALRKLKEKNEEKTPADWFTYYNDILEWFAGAAGFTNIILAALVGLVGINFVVEFLLNLVLGPTIHRVITVIKTKKLVK